MSALQCGVNVSVLISSGRATSIYPATITLRHTSASFSADDVYVTGRVFYEVAKIKNYPKAPERDKKDALYRIAISRALRKVSTATSLAF